MRKKLMATILSTVMAATMLVTGGLTVQAADAPAKDDPAVELIFTSVSVSPIVPTTLMSIRLLSS